MQVSCGTNARVGYFQNLKNLEDSMVWAKKNMLQSRRYLQLIDRKENQDTGNHGMIDLGIRCGLKEFLLEACFFM